MSLQERTENESISESTASIRPSHPVADEAKSLTPIKTFNAYILSPTFDRKSRVYLCFDSTNCFIEPIESETEESVQSIVGAILEIKLVDLTRILGKPILFIPLNILYLYLIGHALAMFGNL
jgi:hypothetical protein